MPLHEVTEASSYIQEQGHEDALISLNDLSGEKLIKVTEAVRKAKKDGGEPWGLTKEGKEELEEI